MLHMTPLISELPTVGLGAFFQMLRSFAIFSFDILNHGIHLSMHFQGIIVRTGISILEKKLLQTLRTFQLAVLSGEGLGGAVDGSGALNEENDFALFGRSPAHLSRLANFLLDALRVWKPPRNQYPN